MSFVSDYPAWFILFCFLSGAVYTFILYFRTKKDELNVWMKRSMMVLRFLAVTVITFLLLSPLIRTNSELKEKPVIIVAQDNSRSVALSSDSSFYRKEYPAAMKELVTSLSKKYETVTFSFGDRVTRGISTSYNESRTDISQIMNEIGSRYSNRNVGALIIASDGIFNHGTSPLYNDKNNFPVYTIALGDTTIHRDVIIKKVIHNKTVFTGDRFPVEIQAEADMMQGEKSWITILDNDKVIERRAVSFPSERSYQTFRFYIEAKEKGIRKYSVEIEPVKGEMSLFNNRQDFYVEVNDTRQKIVFLYSSPHPDIGALRSALETSARYEIEDSKITDFSQPPDKYDLIVLSQLPAAGSFASLDRIMQSKSSLLFILGSQSDINTFNSLKTGLAIGGFKGGYSETLPAYNKDFSLFTVDGNITEMLQSVPPLVTPFGAYQYSPASDVLFYQKIGNVTSNIPQIFFISSTDRKTGIIAGENIWKWRLSDYLQNENHEAFDELAGKIVQYLAVKGDKTFFRLTINSRFAEYEDVEMQAELYNESYELINEPDVNIIITDSDGNKFPFVMGKTGKSYQLNAGTMKTGRYKYVATVKEGKNNYTRNGEFVVTPVNLEEVNTVADHNLMFRLADINGGKMVYPRHLDELIRMIESREDIRPVSYIQKRYSDLVGNIIVFLLILGLLSAEWFLRKRNGSY